MPRRSASPSAGRSRRDDSDDERRKRHRDRDRSRSPSRRESKKDKKRSKDEEEEEEERTVESLESAGVTEIGSDDYFQKAVEFRAWLREEKSKYIDELSGDSSRKYFKKFCKRWNSCTLPKRFYSPQSTTSIPSASQTAYKWSFANNRSKVDKQQLAAMREDVDRMTNGNKPSGSVESARPAAGPSRQPIGPSIGPAMPNSMAFSANHTDRQLALEAEREDAARRRKAERQTQLSRAEELVPKSGGREGKMDERRANNAVNREFREKDQSAGMELDEGTLLGGGDSFARAVAQRNAAQTRRQDRRGQFEADKRSASTEKFSEMKAKDNETMAMFKQMAQARFGGGGGAGL